MVMKGHGGQQSEASEQNHTLAVSCLICSLSLLQICCGVGYHYRIVCHTAANHHADFRPWRRDLNFKSSPAKLVRRLALNLCS
ncbi:hypothetical protein SRHO_G00179860 [Serrasalmus rhombeus]